MECYLWLKHSVLELFITLHYVVACKCCSWIPWKQYLKSTQNCKGWISLSIRHYVKIKPMRIVKIFLYLTVRDRILMKIHNFVVLKHLTPSLLNRTWNPLSRKILINKKHYKICNVTKYEKIKKKIEKYLLGFYNILLIIIVILCCCFY